MSMRLYLYAFLLVLSACKSTQSQTELSDEPKAPLLANQMIQVNNNKELKELIDSNPDRTFLIMFSMPKTACEGCFYRGKDMEALVPALPANNNVVPVYYQFIDEDSEPVDGNVWGLQSRWPEFQLRNRKGLIVRVINPLRDRIRSLFSGR